MFVSPAVLAEYEEVRRRPRLKLDPAKIADVLALIRTTYAGYADRRPESLRSRI